MSLQDAGDLSDFETATLGLDLHSVVLAVTVKSLQYLKQIAVIICP